MDGELIASGTCEVNRDRGEVTMWPSFEVHALERERGPLMLTLDDMRVLNISERHLTFKLQGEAEQRISVYRLRIVPSVPEHLAAGYTPAMEQDDASEGELELMERVRADEAARMGAKD
jgi:hypothetical protein